MDVGEGKPVNDPAAHEMARELRGQIAERVKAQHQLLLLAVAIAGAAISLQERLPDANAEVFALLSMLFAGIALAVLRQDQEATAIASHLLREESFGSDAIAQQKWENHRLESMQGGYRAVLASTAMTVGIYGIPVLGTVTLGVAATRHNMAGLALGLLVFTGVLMLLFLWSAWMVAQDYRALGTYAKERENERSEEA